MAQAVTRTQCPKCDSDDYLKDNLVHHADGSSHCYACGYHVTGMLEKDPVQEKKSIPLLPIGKFVPLSKRKIPQNTCEKYGVHLAKDGGRDVLVFPFYSGTQIIAQKCKTPDKKIYWKGNAKAITMFGSQLFGAPAQRLIITEGEEDCLAAAHVLDQSNSHVTTLTNGSNSVEQFYKLNHEKLLQYAEIVIAMDQDEAGEAAANKFLSLLPPGKVRIAKFSEKDASDMVNQGKENELRWALLKAERPTMEGIVDLSDLSLAFFEEEFEPGEMTGYTILDRELDGIRKAELTMLTSGTGMGKTTFINDIVYTWAKRGLKIADIKLEKNIRRTIYDYMAMHYGIAPRKFAQNTGLITEQQKQEFLDTFGGNLYFLKHFGSLDSNKLLALLDYYATVLKVDYIFLDHISIAVSGNDGGIDGERKEIDKLLTKIRELINRTGVGFICVSHLKNPPNGTPQWEEGRTIRRSDLRGSGSLAQLSDNIIAIEGTLTEVEKKNDRQLKILKARDGDSQESYCDTWTYSPANGKVRLKKDVEII